MKDLIRKTQEFKDLRAQAREAIAPLVANRSGSCDRFAARPLASANLTPSARANLADGLRLGDIPSRTRIEPRSGDIANRVALAARTSTSTSTVLRPSARR